MPPPPRSAPWPMSRWMSKTPPRPPRTPIAIKRIAKIRVIARYTKTTSTILHFSSVYSCRLLFVSCQSFTTFFALLGGSWTLSADLGAGTLGPVNLAPQFQQNASPCQERAPQFGQNREAAPVLGGGATGGAETAFVSGMSRGAGGGGNTVGAWGGRGVSAVFAEVPVDALSNSEVITGGAFITPMTLGAAKTAPHSSQEVASTDTIAPQFSQTYPRKSTPRFPTPRSRFGWNVSSRFASNTRARFRSNWSSRTWEEPRSRLELKLRRFAIVPLRSVQCSKGEGPP